MQQKLSCLNKIRSFSKGIGFCILCCLFLSFSSPLKTDYTTDQIVLVGNALEFFEREADELAVENLMNRILSENWFYPSLMEKILNIAIQRKNREMIYSLWRELANRNACLLSKTTSSIRSESKNCQFLMDLWKNNLESLLFFEESAPKLETARRLIKAKDCIVASGLIDQVRSREGISPQILRMQIEASVCQKDAPSANKFKNELKALLLNLAL